MVEYSENGERKLIRVRVFIDLMSCLKSSTSSVYTSSRIRERSLPIGSADVKLGVKLGLHENVLNKISWPARISFRKFLNPMDNAAGEERTRRIGVQSLVMPPSRRSEDPKADWEKDDQNMKMKLFRLMYESVRDSDLKVKRAELIKKSYANSSVFEIGYLLGDVTDKYNIMTDMAKTLKRLYHDWKPIEHINAYEQIANLGIDVGHVVDMLRGVEKKLLTEQDGEESIRNPEPTESNLTTPSIPG